MPCAVLSLNHVSVLVSDLERSIHFYEQILGLVRLERPELGFAGAWYALGNGVSLHLLCLDNPDPVTGRPSHSGRDRHIALNVDDLDASKTCLDEVGVSYSLSRSGRQSIFFRDPDGNGIELMRNEIS